eukprot:Opistho-2@46876
MEGEEELGSMPEFPANFRKNRRCSVSAESMTPSNETHTKTEKVVIHKSKESYKRIDASTQRNLLFRNLDEDQRKDVADAMFERKVTAGEVIIQQGDEGDNFYVVDSGSFDVFVDGRKVLQITDGGSFGELALMYNAPRAATVKAVSDSVLWAVDRMTFRRILMDTTSTKRRLYESFLSTVPILESLTPHERCKVADALEPVTFNAGEVIIRQGDNDNDRFYIVESGKCVVKKQFPDKKEAVEVMKLGRGGYFGEIALLTDQPRAATVIALDTVKCVVLDRASFVRLMGPCQDILKRNIENYRKIDRDLKGGQLV